jgi:hypothetical protein
MFWLSGAYEYIMINAKKQNLSIKKIRMYIWIFYVCSQVFLGEKLFYVPFVKGQKMSHE